MTRAEENIILAAKYWAFLMRSRDVTPASFLRAEYAIIEAVDYEQFNRGEAS